MYHKILSALAMVLIEQLAKPLLAYAVRQFTRAKDISKNRKAAKKLKEATSAKEKKDAANNMP